MKKFYYIFLICILFLSLAACGSPEFSASYSSVPEEEWVWYENGTYLAGTDIPAGIYYFEYVPYKYSVKDSFGFVSVDSEKTNDVILLQRFGFMKVNEGEYLTVTEGRVTQASNIPPIQERGPGMYRVGIDLPSGEYQLQAKGETTGYAAVFKTCRTDGDNVLTEFTDVSGKSVKVSNGQYLYLGDAEIVE